MSFVTVKYADNQVGIFNHNCRNDVLLGCIKEHCGLKPADNIDLSDENGHVKQLHYNLDDYGTNFLKDREILVLLRVNSTTASMLVNTDDPEKKLVSTDYEDITYTPLLDLLDNDIQFLTKLNPSKSKKNLNGKRKKNGEPKAARPVKS